MRLLGTVDKEQKRNQLAARNLKPRQNPVSTRWKDICRRQPIQFLTSTHGALWQVLPVLVLMTVWLGFIHPLVLLGQTTNGLSVAPPNQWSQFRGTPALTGVSTADLRDTLELLWTLDVGESIDSSASIVDGTVYVGTYLGELIAIDLTTGEPKWRYQASTEVGIGESSPAVGHGLVFVGDLSGMLHAVHSDTGKRAWVFQTDGEIKSSPVVVDDHLLIGSYDGYLYGLQISTGELVWKFRLDGPVSQPVLVVRDLVVVSTDSGTIYAFGRR